MEGSPRNWELVLRWVELAVTGTYKSPAKILYTGMHMNDFLWMPVSWPKHHSSLRDDRCAFYDIQYDKGQELEHSKFTP